MLLGLKQLLLDALERKPRTPKWTRCHRRRELTINGKYIKAY
jgi:hypothetical protein